MAIPNSDISPKKNLDFIPVIFKKFIRLFPNQKTMKQILIFTVLFSAALGSHAQSEMSRTQISSPLQDTKLKLSFSVTKQTPNMVLFEKSGELTNVDSLNFKIVSKGTIQAEDVVYLMPIKEPESESYMPVYIPNPEIHYTILEKKLGGIILDPRKD